MGDELINQLAIQVAQLRSRIEELARRIEELGDDTMDDVFLRIDSGEVGDAQGTGTFRVEDGKITHCRFYAAHAVVELADVELGENPGGTWFLNVPHDDTAGASVSKTAGQNNDDNTAIPLFELNDDLEIDKDYRAMPFIPIYA